jgi:hypothetical protein
MHASPLQEFGGMEIAYFKLKPGASEQALLRVAALIERDFFAELPGLVHHGLIKGADGLYADITFATSQARAEEICVQWEQNPHAGDYLALMAEDSTQLTFWSRL